MTTEKLLKAAEAIRAREALQAAMWMTDAQLDQIIRSSPLWAAVPNPPLPGEPISDAQLQSFARACQIAEALGIES